MAADPYTTLGVSPGASEADVRAAYRRLVQLHHPDHNHGSAESARRFEDVQEAYARIRELRAGAHMPPPRARGATPPSRARGATPPPRARGAAPAPPPASDPGLEARLADLERQLREAQQARERASRAAREAAARETENARAAAAGSRERSGPSDEELGYIKTNDSFGKILTDARDALLKQLDDVREPPQAERATDRAADLLDEVGALLRGERRKPPDA